MILLILTIVFWVAVYALEAKHDLNYKTIDGSEKLWDAGMFVVLHLGFSLLILYYDNWLNSFLLGVISVMIRVVFHDGFINIFRGRDWCGEFTVDNDKDYWDMFMVYLYNKGIKPCIVTIALLFLSVLAYVVLGEN